MLQLDVGCLKLGYSLKKVTRLKQILAYSTFLNPQAYSRFATDVKIIEMQIYNVLCYLSGIKYTCDGILLNMTIFWFEFVHGFFHNCSTFSKCV